MTDFESIQQYCQNLHPEVTAEFPFDSETLTMKIGGKIFCFIPLGRMPQAISVKGHPEEVLKFKEERQAGFSGAYLNSKHWLSIYLNSDITPAEIENLITTSFRLIVNKLTKKKRSELGLA